MQRELNFSIFGKTIEDQIENSHKYEQLKEEERKLTQEI